MHARGNFRGGYVTRARVAFRWVTTTLTVLALSFGFTTVVGAQTPTFEIIVPLSTVVRAPEGSVTVLNTSEIPGDLIGETCRVTARSENQSSIHPKNDLIVESETSIVLEDVEAESGGTVTATDNMILSEELVISLVMGPDEVFSAGIQVQFDCPPEPTTTTTQETTTTSRATSTTGDDGGETTTTTQATTTTTDDDDDDDDGDDDDDDDGRTTTTTQPTTTSTSEITDTTDVATTTTGVPTTTSPPSTTTEGEKLAFTGPEDDGLGLLALTLAAIGALLLVGERSLAYSPARRSLMWKRCRRCGQGAVFMTPHGGLCYSHTRRALHDDEDLWMPRPLL